MELNDYRQQVGELADKILDCLESFFVTKGAPFDRAGFVAETSVDLRTLATEAHIYGANLTPRYDQQGEWIAA